MSKKLCTFVCIAVAFFLATSASAASVPYSLNTTDLSATSTVPDTNNPGYYYYVGNAIDGDYAGNPWWVLNHSGESILITFNDGMKSIDKIQIVNENRPANPIEQMNLFYTTDINPTLSSTFQPLTDLNFINTITNGIINQNIVYLNTVNSEILIAFSAVNATGIKITDYHTGVLSNYAMYSEITIDEVASSVPEPSSMILLGISALGLAHRKLKK